MSADNLSASGGRFFEWLLKELTENLRIAIPARFKRAHDIGSLWPPTIAKLNKHRGFKATHPILTEQLDASAWVRNACGAHHNPTSAPPTPQEVQEFGKQLADFYKAVFCEKCGYFIEEQSDEGWRCACSEISYPKNISNASTGTFT
jgi:hypothetical protein